jgi:hypothetical protein
LLWPVERGMHRAFPVQDDAFRAQLAEPARVAGRVFAPGSVVEGTVVRSVAPRMLNRAGRLYLRADRIVPADGEALRVDGSLGGAEADAQARFALDEEGTLYGRKPGIVNGLVDLGDSYFLGKIADDISETPIRAIGASMSDAAVANAARYVGVGTSVAFLITRHRRDAYLPKSALMEIDFGRAKWTATAARPRLIRRPAPGSHRGPGIDHRWRSMTHRSCMLALAAAPRVRYGSAQTREHWKSALNGFRFAKMFQELLCQGSRSKEKLSIAWLDRAVERCGVRVQAWECHPYGPSRGTC